MSVMTARSLLNFTEVEHMDLAEVEATFTGCPMWVVTSPDRVIELAEIDRRAKHARCPGCGSDHADMKIVHHAVGLVDDNRHMIILCNTDGGATSGECPQCSTREEALIHAHGDALDMASGGGDLVRGEWGDYPTLARQMSEATGLPLLMAGKRIMDMGRLPSTGLPVFSD
jgi:hypothetical protein